MSSHVWLRAASGTAIALGLLALLSNTPARAQIHTATLAVVVTADDGTPLPGVTVEVVNTDTGVRRLATTDASGALLMPALPPGAHNVSAHLDGMREPIVEPLTLLVGQRAQVRLILRPAISEAITVSGDMPIVDVYRLDSSTNVTPQQIEAMPVLERKYEHLAFVTPNVQRDRQEAFNRTGAPVLATAGNAGQTAVMVDGADYTDPFMGMSRIRFGQDAIREFRVLNRFDTEMGPSAGGVLSIVTKSGANLMRGNIFGFYGGEAMRAKGALEQEKADFSRYHLGLTLGGPIAHDKTHYFVSAEYIEDNDTVLFRPGGAFVDLAEDLPHPIEQLLALVSLDHSFGPSSVGTLKFNYERKREDNYQVGGVKAEENGWGFHRDGWNVLLNHSWVLSDSRLNELRAQAGRRQGDWPLNTSALTEWFSFGSTLQAGGELIGDNCADDGRVFELRDTYHFQLGRERDHQFKVGASWQRRKWSYREDDYQHGFLVYADDTRLFPLVYLYGIGSSAVTQTTNLIGAFVQDDWRAADNLTVSLGLRYDLDTDGNNPDFAHALLPKKRDPDSNNLQLRLGLSWDMTRDGRNVLRAGVGQFVGRYPFQSIWERMFNEESGRAVYRNLNFPPVFSLDPDNPLETGYPLPPEIFIHGKPFDAPEMIQATLGYGRRLGESRLYLDVELAYAEGKREFAVEDSNWGGNDNPIRPNPDYFGVWSANNRGRSRYQSATLGLNGTVSGGHHLSVWLTAADKKAICDDVLGACTPSDPADVEAEWGRAASDERYRLVASGAFLLPWGVTVAPVFEYGSGQPWNRWYGYDYNSDFSFTDRPEGVARNDRDGPTFRQLNLRVSKSFELSGQGSVELILDAFNLLDTANYDVNSVDDAMYFDGPTLFDPTIPYVPNPRFGKYTAAHEPRQVQLGVRYRF